jgi:hypothetical protein
MAKVDRKIVEAEVEQMFEAHKTVQDVVEALLIEIGWDAKTIHAAQEVRKVEEERKVRREANKKEAPQVTVQRLAQEQEAERVEDEKNSTDRVLVESSDDGEQMQDDELNGETGTADKDEEIENE